MAIFVLKNVIAGIVCVCLLSSCGLAMPIMPSTPTLVPPTVETEPTLQACKNSVSDFVETICGAIVRRGSSEETVAQSDNIELFSNQLFDEQINKLSPDSRARIVRKRSSYVGVIQEHLIEDIQSVLQCREKISHFAYQSCEVEQQQEHARQCTAACRDQAIDYQFRRCLINKNEACKVQSTIKFSTPNTRVCDTNEVQSLCKTHAAQKLHNASNRQAIEQCAMECQNTKAK